MNIAALRKWFFRHKRPLPWRDNPTPYRVWISEVMLQQTQASRVIPFFEAWMERFPTVAALADAPLDDVLKAWEGLGYYSRARNLHKAAQAMRSGIPATQEELSRVPGLGPYTVGAILSFAFHQKAPAVDANVVRVMARFDAIEEEVTAPRIRKQIEERVSELLPDEEPWIIGEALIELGALVCTKEPQCLSCPLRSECLGVGRGDLPKKRKGKGVTLLYRAVAIVETARGYIVSKAPEGRVMAGLWHFPYIELERPPADLESMRPHFEAQFEAPLTYVKSLEPLTHTFTRYKAHLFPSLWRAPDLDTGVSIDELHALPFTSGHRTLRSLVRN